MSVDFTARKPNFKTDIDTYGTWGESLFTSLYMKAFEEKKYGVYNVSKDPFFQERDIDFIIAKKPLYGEDYDGLDNDKLYPDEFPEDLKEVCLTSPDFERVEVKVDTRTITTGNIPYEVISHGQPGWSLVTKCNRVFFIIARENGNALTPVSSLWLDMEKWHEYIYDRTTRKTCNFIKSESGIADLLCKVEDLRNYGVIVSEKSLTVSAS